MRLLPLVTLFSLVACGGEDPIDPSSDAPVSSERPECTRPDDCESGVCLDGACADPSCDDEVQNGDETDVDCGGSCPPCDLGGGCDGPEDCISETCIEGICVDPSCDDGVLNGDETDIDCGGSCPPCGDGKDCIEPTDCTSGVCDEGTCAEPSCTDGVQNGGETGVDCGGPDCEPCADGTACAEPSDCLSGVCTDEICAEPTCDDGVKNGSETDIDCGGPDCEPCDSGLGCEVGEDCLSFVCTDGVCAMPFCTDGVMNGEETDIDCGGPDCEPCADGLACLIARDCESSVCDEEICAVPTCDDGVHNGDETDVDCGGSCPPCGDGGVCFDPSDCASGVCLGETCAEPTCDDGVHNGDETDIDCGGPDCEPCGPGGACEDSTDCGEASTCDPDTLTCTCDPGFEVAGDTCVDIDECALGIDDCYFICTNTPGSYTCTCPPGTVGDGVSCDAQSSCAEIKSINPDVEDGAFVIETGMGGPIEVWCDMSEPSATYVRLTDSELGTDPADYHAACAEIGMEVVVTQTRGQARYLADWLGEPPNLVGVYPTSDDSAGLVNWEGRCQGAACTFFLSDSHDADCVGDLQPTGTGPAEHGLIRFGDDPSCAYGQWRDVPAEIADPGWVVCALNEPQTKVRASCRDYAMRDEIRNVGPEGISGLYPHRLPDGTELDLLCDFRSEGTDDPSFDAFDSILFEEDFAGGWPDDWEIYDLRGRGGNAPAWAWTDGTIRERSNAANTLAGSPDLGDQTTYTLLIDSFAGSGTSTEMGWGFSFDGDSLLLVHWLDPSGFYTGVGHLRLSLCTGGQVDPSSCSHLAGVDVMGFDFYDSARIDTHCGRRTGTFTYLDLTTNQAWCEQSPLVAELRIRGRSVQVWLDGAPKLQAMLPEPRPIHKVGGYAFDCDVGCFYDRFTLLPAEEPAFESCEEILSFDAEAPSGVYQIDTGSGPTWTDCTF